MDHMPWFTHCRRVGFGLAVAMVLTEHLGAQEHKAVSPLFPPRPAATEAVHDIPLCADSAHYVHQIPSTSATQYLPILIQPSGTSTSPSGLSQRDRYCHIPSWCHFSKASTQFFVRIFALPRLSWILPSRINSLWSSLRCADLRSKGWSAIEPAPPHSSFDLRNSSRV